jgi:hypothetical protein
MSTYQEKMTDLKAKQDEIMQLQSALKAAESALQAKVEEFITTNKVEVNEIGAKLEKLLQEYRAETKAAFGLADGEKINILEVVEAIRRVQGMA